MPSKDLMTCRVSRESKVAMNSRNGIYETSSLSWGSPFHFGNMMAFSGWSLACAGTVSSMMILLRSRFRYERS